VDDLSGSVWEWTSSSSDRAVVDEASARGGSFLEHAGGVRVTFRRMFRTDQVSKYLGARLCASAPDGL
jgi:formylglycine-generating enzyme required for sulfatase activity